MPIPRVAWRLGRADLAYLGDRCNVMTDGLLSFRLSCMFATLCGILLLVSTACRRDEIPDAPADSPSVADADPLATAMIFPVELYVDDESVNTFVNRAMTVIANGEYEPFRLLWSVREEPLPQDEFEKGWQAVQEIRVRALQRLKVVDNQDPDAAGLRTAYGVCVDVVLDPAEDAGQTEPRRQVVLMVVREHEGWRLARAPQKVRRWMTDKLTEGTGGEPNITQTQGEDDGQP